MTGAYRTFQPVGTKAPNELGIYDMSGNVSEWCSDYYDKYSEGAQINPTGPVRTNYRVVRGGNSNEDVSLCRVSARVSHYWLYGSTISNYGFRLIMEK